MEELKTKSLAFVLALCDPSLDDRSVAWEGVSAALAQFTVGNNMEGLQKAIYRIRKMTAPDPAPPA